MFHTNKEQETLKSQAKFAMTAANSTQRAKHSLFRHRHSLREILICVLQKIHNAFNAKKHRQTDFSLKSSQFTYITP